mgnify:CR=1 FL=1
MEEGSGVHVNLGAQVTLSSLDSNHFQPFSVLRLWACAKKGKGWSVCVVRALRPRAPRRRREHARECDLSSHGLTRGRPRGR